MILSAFEFASPYVTCHTFLGLSKKEVYHNDRVWDEYFDPNPSIEPEPYQYRTKPVSVLTTRYGTRTANLGGKKFGTLKSGTRYKWKILVLVPKYVQKELFF